MFTWAKAATVMLIGIAAPWHQSLLAASPKAKKHKAPPKRKKPIRKVVAIPSKPPADIPMVMEAASVWRGCLEATDVPRLALNLGVEESRMEELVSDLGLEAKETSACVPYVAAKGGEGGAASAIFERPNAKPGESAALDLRRTADGITVTPGACDCPEAMHRVLDVPAEDLAQGRTEGLASVPSGVHWQLDVLLPQMLKKLAAGPSYNVRIGLDRTDDDNPERLESLEILDASTGKRADGVWWLDRPGRPGVFIGMDGLAYERLLWQSPVKYITKSRGTGPATTTFRRRVPAPKGSKGKATVRSVTVREYHLGSDLMAPKGTDVHTVGDAKVSFAGRMGGFGKLIILDHGLGYQTYYAHLSEIKPWIKIGATVARGEVIGLVGSTGHSTAPHLHFETRKDAKFIDPFDGTRQLDFWLLTPDDQERLAMKLLAKPAASMPTDSAAENWARKQ